MSSSALMPAPELVPARTSETQWDEEWAAFFRLLPELMKTQRGQYVAVNEGKVVESGPELVDVAMKAYGRYGYAPMYIDPVSLSAVAVRIPSRACLGL